MDKRKNKIDSVVDDFLTLTAEERKQVLSQVKRVERTLARRIQQDNSAKVGSIADGPTFIQAATHEDEPEESADSPAEFFPVAV